MKRQDKARPIFQEYDCKLASGTPVEWGEFEMSLRNALNIGYQEVKTIVLAFYDSG